MVAKRNSFPAQGGVRKPVRKLVLTPAQYDRMLPMYRDNIRRARILPARLGGKGFGAIKVEFQTPVLM
jgi:hypothetical protein